MVSYTTWTRLEPRTRDGELADGLRAAVHDPLWLLGRQWQTGELVGEDAGSLIDASLSLDVTPMARGRGGGVDGTGTDVVFSDGDGDASRLPPLEILVERERVAPDEPDADDRDLRLAAEAGSHLLRLLSAEFGVEATAFPDDALLASDDRDEDTERYSSVVGGRALDGDAVYHAYDIPDFTAFETAVASDAPPPLPDSLDTDDSNELRTYWEAVQKYRAWYDDRYSEPHPTTDTWDDDRLEYAYAVSTGSGDDETVLTANAYEGGRLDWYSFDVDQDASLEPEEWSGPLTTSVSHSLVPTPTTFDGMPADRWWEFEDDGVDLSAVEAAPEDLSRLLLMEFALVYGNDWFTVPVDLPVGSLSRVERLELETTFGETITVDDAVIADDDPTTSWNVYSMPLDANGGDRGLFLAPTLVEAVDSSAVESVEFARDEIANVGWAIESTVEGGVGQARNRDEEVAGTVETPPVATAEDADVAYQLATDVPQNWYPLLPRQVSPGNIHLELGRLFSDDDPPTHPLGEILNADITLPEEEVSRTGETVDRRYQYTRWTDGSTYCWSGRETHVGSGGSSSGLAFDELVDPRMGDAGDAVEEPELFPDAEPVPPEATLELTDLRFETSGGPDEPRNLETVTFTNVGGSELDVSGWRVAMTADDYTFAEGTVLRPGQSLSLHTGEGTDTDTDVYWGQSQTVPSGNDTLSVYDADDSVVLRHDY